MARTLSSSALPLRRKSRRARHSSPWARAAGKGAVLRLALDVHDPLERSRLEKVFATAFALRRALQRDARNRATAYRAAPHERTRRGPEAVRERLGFTREGLERAAYAHLDAAPDLRRFVTKALAMHLADSVWTPLARHLFPDASGKRQGLLRVGRWFDFARLPGRARSHTKSRKWETFRLHGTLDGHRAAYSNPSAPLFQPRVMRPVPRPADSWWSHKGPLVVVFSGLVGGELVLPVRLPASPSNQPALDYDLSATTALSQHCICGSRVEKTLGERVHRCPDCSLSCDRDAMSAVLASVVRFGDPTTPMSALLDRERARTIFGEDARATLIQTITFPATKGRQDAPSESTAPSASEGPLFGKTGRTSPAAAMMARRNVGTALRTTPDETRSTSWTTSDRARRRTNLPDGASRSPPLRDSS